MKGVYAVGVIAAVLLAQNLGAQDGPTGTVLVANMDAGSGPDGIANSPATGRDRRSPNP